MNPGPRLFSGLRLSEEVLRNGNERGPGGTDGINRRQIFPLNDRPNRPLSERKLPIGWLGHMPCWKNIKVIFPTDVTRVCSVNMDDSEAVLDIIRTNGLIGMLCFDDLTGSLTRYGVLCEIFEAVESSKAGKDWVRLAFKVRGLQRFNILEMPSTDMHHPKHIMNCKIRILPEILSFDCLRKFRLPSLQNRSLNIIHSSVSPWPSFVYQVFDSEHLLNYFKLYFNVDHMDGVPSDLVEFSFWVITHVYCLSHADRVALLPLDNVFHRLHAVAYQIKQRFR